MEIGNGNGNRMWICRLETWEMRIGNRKVKLGNWKLKIGICKVQSASCKLKIKNIRFAKRLLVCWARAQGP